MNASYRLWALFFAVTLVFCGTPSRAAAPTIDGIRCDEAEGVAFHIHQHLAIFDHGKTVPIPGDVGRPLAGRCLYWLHTHAAGGIIHVEAPVLQTFTLGQFFDVWGQPLSPTRVAAVRAKPGEVRVFVGGRRFSANPRTAQLSEHADMVIEVGPPYTFPAPFTNWDQL